ncbi:MAG: lipopolysaccharide assembly protein LapA domain-containing protein [Pseudobdellovibrionaceae bacterium]
MTALIRWLFTALIALAVLAFTLANLNSVDVALTPVTPPLSLPLYFVILGSTVLGFIWGAVLVWLNGWPTRRALKAEKKKSAALDKELDDLRAKLPKRAAPEGEEPAALLEDKKDVFDV